MVLSSLEKFVSPKTWVLKENIEKLISAADEFGLSEADTEISREFMAFNEHGLAFDHVLTQLYEYSIPIDDEFLSLSEEICQSMGQPFEDYVYIAELVKK